MSIRFKVPAALPGQEVDDNHWGKKLVSNQRRLGEGRVQAQMHHGPYLCAGTPQ